MAPGGRPKVNCPVCGTAFGDLVTACPKCGAMNPGHRGQPPMAPPSREPPPPAQQPYYGPPPAAPGYPPQQQQYPPQYPAQYPAQPGYPPQYPPGYGYPQPQPKPGGALAVVGILFSLGAFISVMIGAMVLDPVCGVSAVVMGIIGLIIGIMLIGKQPAQAKMIIVFSSMAIVTTLIIVIMFLAILD